MPPDLARLQSLLGGSALANLRYRLRARYERGAPGDTFTLSQLSLTEREALQGLLGRPGRRANSMRVSMTELDEALARAGVATSLREGIEALDGPIRELAAERAAFALGWEAVFAGAAHPLLHGLLSANKRRGLLKRLAASSPATGERLLLSAQGVLQRLPAQGVALSRLAADVLGDAHALDEGRPVATLVLAALAVGREPVEDSATENDARLSDEKSQERSRERRRNQWARVGVLVNELAKPVLVLNLSPLDDTPAGCLARTAAERGEPMHLSLRALLRSPLHWNVERRIIYVCENPAVVAIAADRLGATCAPLVCTDGMPAAAQRTLLVQLAAAGARLCYHGDFDWPGVTIANFVMRAFGAAPWRYGAEEYSRARPESGYALAGAPVEAAWDVGLTAAMIRGGFAIHEEAVVEQMLEDLDAVRAP